MIFMKTQSNFYLFLIALISAMGGFLFGYDWVVIGGAKPFYEQYFGIANDPVMQGWAMSSALIGCLFGALSAGKLSDRLGRKPILILAAGLFICTAVGTGAVHSFTFFNVFRLVGGFAIGIASSLSPMYIAEIAPAHLRGRFVSINQLTVVLGILTSQIVNWQIAEPVALGATHEMIRESWNGQMGWRWMFWAMTVPAALFFVFSFILPESPRWLASSGKREAALKVFTRMGGKEYAVTELAAIEAVSACQTQEGGYRQLLNPAMYKVLTIGVVMAILQQWCGINVIFNYAQEIFMAAGYGVSDVLMNIVVTGITNVIFTILAMFVVDRWGRKALTLIGSFGLAVIYTFMGAAYYFHITGVVLLIIVVMAIACYAMTLATVMWVIISEIFPNRIRGVAMSVCTFALGSSPGCFRMRTPTASRATTTDCWSSRSTPARRNGTGAGSRRCSSRETTAPSPSGRTVKRCGLLQKSARICTGSLSLNSTRGSGAHFWKIRISRRRPGVPASSGSEKRLTRRTGSRSLLCAGKSALTSAFSPGSFRGAASI